MNKVFGEWIGTYRGNGYMANEKLRYRSAKAGGQQGQSVWQQGPHLVSRPLFPAVKWEYNQPVSQSC